MTGRFSTTTRSAPSVAAALCLFVLTWGVEAAAQRVRYDRTTKIRVKVKQTERTKKITEPREKQEARPSLSADDFIRVLGAVTHIRKSQIDALKMLIGETDRDDTELPDLHFRLAEMYSQQQRYWNHRGMEMFTKIERSHGREKHEYIAKQRRYMDASKYYLKEAVREYQKLFDNESFKAYKRMDQAIFYYAYTLQQAKYFQEARKVFHRLIKDYPQSKYVPDAYLAFADYFFEQNSLSNAEKFYDKVLEFPQSSIYVYALYKKGWVYLNLGQHKHALETFYRVVEQTRRDEKRQVINRAAKKDFVRAYAEVGKPQRAYQAFARVDRHYAFDMLQILADIYLEQGKSPQAIYTLRHMIKRRPKHKMVCEWQAGVVQAILLAGTKEQQVDEIENLVKLYRTYSERRVLPKSALEGCGENAEAYASEMAKVWHNEANKTLNPDTLAHVERLYSLFLANFKGSKEYGEMQYYFAELMWQRAKNEADPRIAAVRWEDAAVAFTDVVKAGNVSGAIKKESAYASVLAWKNALDVDPHTAVRAPERIAEGDAPNPREIPHRERRMIDAFDIYINYIKDPKDEDLVGMKFLKARIYWRYSHLDTAVPLFEDIVRHHLDHETGEYAANLLLDSLNRKREYGEMLKWVDFLLERKSFLAQRQELAERLELLKRQSLRKAAEKLEEKGDHVACGQSYLDIFNRDPNGANVEEVLYNAGVCFEKGKSIGAAIQMFNTLRERFPDATATKRAIARLGSNYGRIAWYTQAAEHYEEYARKFAGEKDAYKALSDAVFYRKGIGDDKQAIEDTEYFVRKYRDRNPADAADALYSLVSIYEKQGDNDKVVAHLRKYLKDPLGRRHGGVDREIAAHVQIGMIKWKESCPVNGVMGACVDVKRARSTRRYHRKKRERDLPTQCGPESKISVKVAERNRRLVKEAHEHFKAAIKLFRNGAAVRKVPGEGEDHAARVAEMIKYYAAANFYLAEKDNEDFLAIEFPSGLDFDKRNKRKREKSLKRFTEWLNEKQEAMMDLAASAGNRESRRGRGRGEGKYMQVVGITGGGAHYAIAAAARIGQLSQNFSDALFTAPIPKDVRSGRYAEDKVDAYCDELTNRANPLEDISVQAFSFCLDTSTKLNWFNEWSTLCERELGQIRPQDFPTASEVFAVANQAAPIVDVEGPFTRLEH